MSINILLATFVYFFIPETKQVPLEEIDVLFGGALHTEHGGEILAKRADEGEVQNVEQSVEPKDKV
jgi:hypothetical protein